MNDLLFIHSDLDDAGLSLPAFRLLCHIARRLGKPGLFPGVDSMAKVCRMERKTVFRALQELEEAGILVRLSRPGRTTEYSINPPGTRGAKRDDPNGTPGGQTGQGVVGQTGRHPSQTAPHEDTPCKILHEDTPIVKESARDTKPPRPSKPKPQRTPSDLEKANAVSLSFLTPPEVLAEWEQWKIYRTGRASGKGSFPWTQYAAETEAGNIEKKLLTFPAEIVAEQIRTAINRGWRDAGMGYLKEPTGQQPAARQSFQQADRSDRQARRHGPEAIPCPTI